MSTTKLHPRIIASIDSCVTFEQVRTCLGFRNCYPDDIGIQLSILAHCQTRLYELRNQDLQEHITKLKAITNS